MRPCIALMMVLMFMVSSTGCSENPPQPEGSACSRHAECEGELLCYYGYCRSECDFDRECDPQICIAVPDDPDIQVCTLPSEDDCSSDRDCPEGLMCAEDGFCRNFCDDAEDCGTNHDCADGLCFELVGGDGDGDVDGDGDSDGDGDGDGDADGDGDGDGDGDCTDEDGDGFGPDCSAGEDCDDGASSCTDDCATDADGDGAIDCLDLCLDVDSDGLGADHSGTVVGSGDVTVGSCTTDGFAACTFADPVCSGAGDCDDSASSCTDDCATDEDGDLVPDCRDLCLDADEDGSGADNGDAEIGTGADAVDDCTTDGATPCDLGGACTGVDCDDEDDNRFPGNTEVCDGIDNDCNGEAGDDEVDVDEDGYLACEECDDTRDQVNPGAPEICDGIPDNNCDGVDDPDDEDDDVDGYRTCEGDCDDSNILIRPGATELCDGLNNDCDDLTDEGCMTCTTDVSGDVEAIQAVIDASSDGDVICVGPGIYNGELTITSKNIHLLGTAGPALTVIDGTDVVILIETVEDEIIVEGFTLQNARYGIQSDANSPSVIVRNMIIDGMDVYGIDYPGSWDDVLAVEDSMVTNCDEAFRAWGGATIRVQRSRISENDEVGMVRVLEAFDSEFTDNFEPTYGTFGIYGNEFSFENCLLAGNETNVGGTYGGGAVAAFESLTATNTAFIDNHTAGSGGAIQAATVTLENVIIAGNSAVGNGGGLYVSGGAEGSSLSNVTIVGNTSEEGVGALYLTDGTMDNVIISDNVGTTGAMELTDSVSVYYSILWNNTPSDVLGEDPGGYESEDPEFLDISSDDPMDWDLHVATTSECVDHGNPAATDPDDSRSDIGAYGGPGADLFDLDNDGAPRWWQPGPYDDVSYPGEGWDCDDFNTYVNPDSGC